MIHYLKGDATDPMVDGKRLGKRIIAHICNDFGGWGAGFVLAISHRWKSPELEYRAWYRSKKNFRLGEVRFVDVEPSLSVANMIAQVGYEEQIPVRYDALAECLGTVARHAERAGASVHMPRIGCGLGGGTWDQVEPIINNKLSNSEVYVYDLPT